MADFLGIPMRRLPLAVALIGVLAFSLSALQGRFNQTDVKKGIALALSNQPGPSARSIFQALVARGEGDPRCDGQVMSQLLGDVDVLCVNPGAPNIAYEFRVLLDGKKPLRAASPAAQALLDSLAHERAMPQPATPQPAAPR